METEVGSHQVTALVRILSSAVQYVVTRFSVSGDGKDLVAPVCLLAPSS
jgi:hypothetical protein